MNALFPPTQASSEDVPSNHNILHQKRLLTNDCNNTYHKYAIKLKKLILLYCLSTIISMMPLCHAYNIACSDYTDTQCANGQTVTVTSGDQILCRGAFSCSSAAEFSAQSWITCDGSSACTNIPIINTMGAIHCHGQESCALSTIETVSSGVTSGGLSCHGLLSCSEMTILDTGTNGYITGYGDHSFANSDITMSHSVPQLRLYGNLAGFGANFECPESLTCSLYCGGSGCVNANFIGNGTWNILRNSTDESIYYSLETQFLEIIGSMVNDQTCTDSNITFDSYQRFPYMSGVNIIDRSEGTASVCGRAENALSSAESIQMGTDNTNSLICSGMFSCSDIAFIKGNIANIICSGHFSCLRSVIESEGNLVVCSGRYSCDTSQITVGNMVGKDSGEHVMVYCAGYGSCDSANINVSSNSNVTVLFSGASAGEAAIIRCKSDAFCRIICVGYNSCPSTTIFDCYFGKCVLECNSETGCGTMISSDPTVGPTMIPTKNPTQQTSNPTTAMPTMPTIVPTESPTNVTGESEHTDGTCSLNGLIRVLFVGIALLVLE